MAKTIVKKDDLGLYVVAGGYITRPFYGTMFKEGDEVKTHHFGGSTDAGVTFNKKELTFIKSKGNFERWCTTGFSTQDYKNQIIKAGYEQLFGTDYKTWDEYLRANTEWYKRHNAGCYGPYSRLNTEFFTKQITHSVSKHK